MSKTYDELKKEYFQAYNRVDKIKDEKEALTLFMQQIKSSPKNEFSQISRYESKQYDMEWINYLEKAVNAINTIVNNPKRNLKTVRNIVPIELAKKTTSESVVHLSQHSQFVKDIDDDGNIIPAKILNIEAEDDYAIYENRFVKCLIDKLIIFCRKRYEFMKDHCDTQEYDILTAKSVSVINGVTFEYESKIKISQPSTDDGKKEYNDMLFQKITMLVQKVNFFKTTEFYKHVKDTKPVRTPILQTNIIVKNVHYHDCYEVWKFLDKYDQLGIKITVKEQVGKFDEQYLNELYTMIMMSNLALRTDRFHLMSVGNEKRRVIAPKVNKKIIDPALEDSKFDMALTYGKDQLTKAQLAAIKRKEAQEIERLKREEKRKKQQELAKLRREQEKEKRRLELEKKRQRQKEQKERELARQRQKLAEQKAREAEKKRRLAEEAAEKQRYLDELEKLRRTRITVKRIAVGSDAKLAKADIVTEDMIRKDSDFINPAKKVEKKQSDLIEPEVITPSNEPEPVTPAEETKEEPSNE